MCSFITPSWTSAIASVASVIVAVLGLISQNKKPSGEPHPTVAWLRSRLIFDPTILSLFLLIVVIAVMPPVLANIIPNNRERVRESMVTEATRITGQSEERIQANIDNSTQAVTRRIVGYVGTSQARSQFIDDALKAAREKGYLSVISQGNKVNKQDYFIPGKWLDDHKQPLLLTKNERTVIEAYVANNPRQNLTDTVFSILNNEAVIGKLLHAFAVDLAPICLSTNEKIGVMCGYVNKLRRAL